MAALFYAIGHSGLGTLKALQSINPNYLALLTLGFLVRAFADFNALLLNAVYAEREVFLSQFAALALAIGFNIALTHLYGIGGTVLTLVIGSAAYAFISRTRVRRNPLLNPRETP